MRKEVFLAILLGLILGGIITFGFYQANKSTQNSTTADTTPSPTPGSEIATDTNLLTINSPKDGAIFSTDSATISGQTNSSDTIIVILTPTRSFVVKPDTNNQFSQNIELDAGGNLIQISAINSLGQRQDQYINLAYSSSFNVQ